MMPSQSARQICESVRRNCEISDASHSTIYSLCTLVLKLRNLYKWERNLEPWQEPDPAEIMTWIDAKENGWKQLGSQEFQPVIVNGHSMEPFAVPEVNLELLGSGLHYGAGYGRGLKPVFFLAEKLRSGNVGGWVFHILGRELARELSSPFAMAQDGLILIRREPFRFFLCDQIRESQGGAKEAMRRSLALYGLSGPDGNLRPDRLPELLDRVVEGELESIIHHEVGELQKSPEDREALQKLAFFFAGGVEDFVARGVQDVLADTHESGMLGYILRERREASLCFYVGYMDGLRQLLFPEIGKAVLRFLRDGDWETVHQAVAAGRRHNLARASLIRGICQDLSQETRGLVADGLNNRILKPLGLSGSQLPA